MVLCNMVKIDLGDTIVRQSVAYGRMRESEVTLVCIGVDIGAISCECRGDFLDSLYWGVANFDEPGALDA